VQVKAGGKIRTGAFHVGVSGPMRPK